MTEDNYTLIHNVEELKALFTDPQYAGSNGYVGEFFIQLNGCRSWKTIFYNEFCDLFYVTNEIDGTEQDLTAEDLFDPKKSKIGEAMEKNAFYFAWF